MIEGELYALAEKAYELTEIAREALQAVSMERGIDLQLKMDPLMPPPRPEDEDLVVFRWEMSIENAEGTMKTLAAAGIPSFLSLEIRADDVGRAHAALARLDEEEDVKDDPEGKREYAILCPKCHSAKVVLKGRTSTLEASPYGVKFQWSCDSCGHQLDGHWLGTGSCRRPVLGGRRVFFPTRTLQESGPEIDERALDSFSRSVRTDVAQTLLSVPCILQFSSSTGRVLVPHKSRNLCSPIRKPV